MRHLRLALGITAALCGVASAQESAPASSTVPRAQSKTERQLADAATQRKLEDRPEMFTIEIKVLEGRGLLQDVPADAKSPIVAAAPAKSGYYPRGRLAPPPPARAILPNPVASPDSIGQPSRSAANKPDEDLALAPPIAATRATQSERSSSKGAELWNDAPKKPGVTVLAAPKLATVAGRPGVVQIQTEQIFTYLEPLGDGKFQAKHTDPTELGMKFVLGVEPVEGDAQAVDVSPLEIQLSVLDGREPVEGLDLDVGKPIIATRSLKTTAKMKLGDTRLIPIPSGPKTQAALLLRISRIASTQQEVIPPRSATTPDPDELSP
jgi:hypothetical protein